MDTCRDGGPNTRVVGFTHCSVRRHGTCAIGGVGGRPPRQRRMSTRAVGATACLTRDGFVKPSALAKVSLTEKVNVV